MSEYVISSAGAKSQMRTQANDDYYSNWKKVSVNYETLGKWNDAGIPEYLLADRISLSEKTMRVIDATLHEDKNFGASKFIHEDLHLSKEAKVKLYFLSNSSERQNVLAYYTYTGDQIPSKEYINDNLIILYPNLSENIIGKFAGIELKYKDSNKQWSNVFPANTNIGWVLLVDAFEGNASIKTKDINAIYSARKYNAYDLPGTVMANRPHTGLFKADGLHILSFEDQPFGRANNPGGGQTIYSSDFKDDVFVVKADPTSSLPPVEDGMVIEAKGILAFEDLWPYKGDYDMNDIVVKYNCKSFMNINDFVITRTEESYTFLNNGAQHENGFGFMLNVATSNIESIDMTPKTYRSGDVLDRTQEMATILLFDNGRTVPVGTEFKMNIRYKKPVPVPGYIGAPYNPFIAVNGLDEDRREVHLIDNKPTAKADLSRFGTGDDLSNPTNKKYYVSSEMYPFAINILGLQEYRIPKEGVFIDMTYPKFKRWAESLGKENKDWYNYYVK